MPGHKGTPPYGDIFGGALPLFDVTELGPTDSLYDAAGPILEAERLAAALYGVRDTMFSASGASLCIAAMLRLAAQKTGGHRIVCGRNVHRSAVHAMALLGLEPVWLWPKAPEGFSLPGRVCAKDISEALAQYSDVAAVYLTSPDYYGELCDVNAAANACKPYRVPLLVDNAHGAHLRFCHGGVLHPAALGASFTCDSAHKTLPVFTGGAMLHLCVPGFTRNDAKQAMALFGTTSPSYLIMLSLDLGRAWLARNGKAAYGALCGRVEELRALAREKGIGVVEGELTDPARLTLDTARAGVAGADAAREMERSGIVAEFADARHVVLLPTPMNSEADFDCLRGYLKNFRPGAPLAPTPWAYERPVQAITLREAVLAAHETLPVEQAAGRVCAVAACPCPPGVPPVMPGERITPEAARHLKKDGVFSVLVVK